LYLLTRCFLIEAITFFRQQLMLYKNMFSPHIDTQTFLSVWLSSFFRLNFTILPKSLLFVLMSFILSTVDSFALPIKFLPPFHQISPIVCKASIINFRSSSFFRSNLTFHLICTTSAFGSFFLSWLVSFNLPVELHQHSSESVTNDWFIH
jgi:hypothetical protein